MSGSTTITPISQIGKTVLGAMRELTAYSGVTPIYDTASTLNAKYGVQATTLPTSLPMIGYFGIGIGGCVNIGTGILSQPYPVLDTNMDLYVPIPFRCVPVEMDLTAPQKALYRMRVRKTIGGADYFLYYLKAITYNQSTVQLSVTDPVTTLQSPYTLDYANLNPTQPTINSSGVVTSLVEEVNVSVTNSLPLTGVEVTEVINVLYGGDLRYAKISELGLYSGQDQSITGQDGSGAPVTYTEVVLAQLNAQYCWNGDDWSNVLKTSTFQIAQGSGALLLLG